MTSPSSTASKLPQEATPPLFSEVLLSTRRASLRLGDCDTQKETRGLFMRLQDILET